MRRNLLILFIAMLIPLNGCAMSYNYIYAPSIEFNNLTEQEIRNVNCTWANIKHKISEYKLTPGKGAVQLVNLSNIKDFYGSVRLVWENEAGKKFEKKFEFTENDLPPDDIKNHKSLLQEAAKKKNYSDPELRLFVRFDFTQDGVEFYTSHTPGEIERSKNSGKIKNKIRQEYLKKKKQP